MLCAELEELEAEYDHVLIALEDESLSAQTREILERKRARLAQTIRQHQKAGHQGGPCFEE